MREFLKLFEDGLGADGTPMLTAEKYPELQAIAMELANEVCVKINAASQNVESAMPYKAQCILEMMIAILEERV